MVKVSVVIPALNEGPAIGAVLDAVRALPYDLEIVVVDDGSTDDTGAVAAAHGAKVVRHATNLGYGRSIKDAVRASSSDVIVLTDADGTYPIDRIPDLLAEFEKGFDMVVGARQGAVYHGTFFKSTLRWFLRKVVEFASGRAVLDVNSGLRVFRKSSVEQYFPDICDGFSFTTTITLVCNLTHRTVGYMPIAYDKRVGHSKVRLARDTLRTLQYITECIVRYNPLKLFVVLAGVTFLVGALTFPWTGVFGLLIGFCAAMVVFALGCIAETWRRPRQ
jgi:glycosyltransferase involved in cell wall biosynthesis